LKLEIAKKIADSIIEEIKHLCEKIEVVGSIRRGKLEVADIDIVLIPQPWMWNTIIQTLKTCIPAIVVETGQELARLKFKLPDLGEVQLDIYRARPETWGILTLIRTGSTEHNIKLCSRAKAKGMTLSAKQGLIKDGKVIASRTEEDIFKALDMNFIEPENREV